MCDYLLYYVSCKVCEVCEVLRGLTASGNPTQLKPHPNPNPTPNPRRIVLEGLTASSGKFDKVKDVRGEDLIFLDSMNLKV